MPEICEVDRMVTYLKQVVPVYDPIVKWGYTVARYFMKPWEETNQFFLNSTFTGVYRKGKYIIFYLRNGIFLSHQRFTGWWEDPDKPDHLNYLEFGKPPGLNSVRCGFQFKSGKRLLFHDARTLSHLDVFPNEISPAFLPVLRRQGPDVVETENTDPAWVNNPLKYNEEWFQLCYRSSVEDHPKKQVKLWLLEQEYHAGVGNILACEALWKAQIHPGRTLESLVFREQHAIYDGVLQAVIAAKENNVVYDKYIKVFRQKTCPRCCGPITRVEQANRGSYCCLTCQPTQGRVLEAE